MREEKRIARLLSRPSDYTFQEATALMEAFGYKLGNKGRTSGSRVSFYRESDGAVVMLHKPHPSNIMPGYSVRDMIKVLKERGDIG